MAAHLENEQRALLEAALTHVPFEGWSRRALAAATRDCGYEPSRARRAFPRGIGDLVDFFAAEADHRMLAALASYDLGAMRIRERIAKAARCRLELLAPHREAVRYAIAFCAQPGRAPAGLAALYRTVDAMWRAAGDTATDFNFYTKRILLSGVYTTTLLYWLDDRSSGSADSWAFLDRRITNVMEIQKARGRLEGLVGRLMPLSQPARSGHPGRGKGG
jgi:ubiquinone biosynthesis protein COQ9